MKIIKIQGEDCEYTFTKHKLKDEIFYNFSENDKLIYKAVDTGDGIELNGKSFDYCEFAELYLFISAIRKSSKNLMGEYVAIAEKKIFEL